MFTGKKIMMTTSVNICLLNLLLSLSHAPHPKSPEKKWQETEDTKLQQHHLRPVSHIVCFPTSGSHFQGPEAFLPSQAPPPQV